MKKAASVTLIIFLVCFGASTAILITPAPQTVIKTEQAIVGNFTKGDFITLFSFFTGTASLVSMMYIFYNKRTKR